MSLVPNDRYGSKSGFLTLGPVTSTVPSSSDNLGPVPHFGFGPLANGLVHSSKENLIRSPRRRKRDRSALHGPHPAGDGPPDLVRRIFLDEDMTFGGKTEASSSLIGGPRRVVSADQHIPTVSCQVAARHFST